MNSLDDIIDWYRTIETLIKTAENGGMEIYDLSVNPPQVFDKTKKKIDEITVVYLWSAFEPLVYRHLESISDKIIISQPSDFYKRIIEYRTKEIDRWRMTEIIELYRSFIPVSIIEQTKKIYNYRNWVAHGKSEKENILLTPSYVHSVLVEFVEYLK